MGNLFNVDIPINQRNNCVIVRENIQDKINECSEKGGGIVYIPAGEYTVSSICLKSNVALKLNDNCILNSPTAKDQFSGFKFDETKNYSKKDYYGIITAFNCENVSITGGKIKGFAKKFWNVNKNIGEMWNSTPSHYTAKRFRPRTLLFYNCKNVSINNLYIEDSPVYSGWFVDCNCVKIIETIVANDFYGVNNDGFHFSSCVDVFIDNCFFTTGDDSIAIDANNCGFSKDIVIRNCTFNTSVNALRIYTGLDPFMKETYKYYRIKNVIMHNCKIINAAGAMNITAQNGEISDVEFFNIDIKMEQEGTTFFLMTDNGSINNVNIRNISSVSNGIGTILGTKDCLIKNINIKDVYMQVMPKRKLFSVDIPDPIPGYWYHHFAPCNLYIRYAEDICIDNLKLDWVENIDYNHDLSAITLIDTANVALNKISAKPYGNNELPVIFNKKQ